MATGPAVWLLLVQREMENVGTDSAGPSSADLADPSYADLAGASDTSSEEVLILPSLEPEMGNVSTVRAGPSSTDLAGPSSTSGEEELVLPTISVPRSRETYGFNHGLYGPLDHIREETEDDSNGTHICRNSCSPDEDNTDTVSSLDVLVELGCHCRGSMSRMCIKCLLKWFGPRIMLDKDMTCEVCQTLLNESVKKTVLSALADHTGGRDILVEALGPPLVRAHKARGRFTHNADVQMLPSMEQEDDLNVDELPDAPLGVADASQDPVDAPDAASDSPDSPATPAPASSAPAPAVLAPNQQQSHSFWTKIRRYMCCAAPAPVL